MHYKNGNRYEGQFVDARPHGFGTLNSANGDKYEGRWEDGLKNGYAKEFIVNNKEFYEGHFERDLRNRDGKIITMKREVYEVVNNKGALSKRSVMPNVMPLKVYQKFITKFLENKPIMAPKV